MKLDLSIALPLFVLAGWTALVLLLIPIARFAALARGKVTLDDFKLGESDRVPDWAMRVNRNYMNLLEMPVLFYVIGLLLVITRQATPAMDALAWGYVALRIMHSVIHLTLNHVSARLLVFAASNAVLLTLWIVAGLRLLSV
jgi:hypothetical protein